MKPIFIPLLLLLAGCGSAYISPEVREVKEATTTTSQVEIIPLTVATANSANKSRYKPRALPSVYRHVSSVPATKTAGALPDPAIDSEDRPQVVEMRVPPKLAAAPYTIGVADVLLLATPTAGDSVAELSGLLAAQNKRQGYTVQDDGAIAIPDVGRVQVAGLTLEEVDAAVFQALVAASINPTFSVEISEFNSQRVSVGGAVGSPVLAPITLKALYLEEALQLAGGVTAPDLDYATVRLYRDGKLFQIPLTQLYAKNELQRIRLKDGDSIFVDTEYELDQAKAYFAEQITLLTLRQSARTQAINELNTEFSIRKTQADEARANFTARESLGAVKRDYVYLGGEVKNQSRFALPFEQQATLADALFSTDGISNREANPSQIYVLRGSKDGSKIMAYQLDARNAANLIVATRLELRPNDVIFVSEQPVTKWNRVVAQIVPSLITSTIAAAQ